MQHLAAVELSEHLEDARDLAARGQLAPALARALQEGPEVPVARVLDGEAIEDAPVLAHEREGVVDADRPGVSVQELPEVGLAQPPVDVLAGLDADRRWHQPREAGPFGQVDLAEPSGAEQPLDAVREPGLRAGDDLRGFQEPPRRIERGPQGPRARTGRRYVVHEANALRGRAPTARRSEIKARP